MLDLMPLLPNPRYNIAQYPNEYFHALSHQFELIFIGLFHVDHGQRFVQGQITILLWPPCTE
jgi:hypothetical protein